MHDETQSVPSSVAVSTEENSYTPTLSVVTSEVELEINTDNEAVEMPVPFSEIPTTNSGTNIAYSFAGYTLKNQFSIVTMP